MNKVIVILILAVIAFNVSAIELSSDGEVIKIEGKKEKRGLGYGLGVTGLGYDSGLNGYNNYNSGSTGLGYSYPVPVSKYINNGFSGGFPGLRSTGYNTGYNSNDGYQGYNGYQGYSGIGGGYNGGYPGVRSTVYNNDYNNGYSGYNGVGYNGLAGAYNSNSYSPYVRSSYPNTNYNRYSYSY